MNVKRAQSEGPLEEPQATTFLVLNSVGEWKPAVLINQAGSLEELTCFDRDDDTEAGLSCSINWENQFHIFGGSRSA